MTSLPLGSFQPEEDNHLGVDDVKDPTDDENDANDIDILPIYVKL